MENRITVIGKMDSKNKDRYMFEKCDKCDYAIAVMAGVVAGFIDVVFVGKPGESILGKQVDKATDKLVIDSAKVVDWLRVFYKNVKGEIADKKEIDNIKKAIIYFEDRFKVNYDIKTSEETRYLVENLDYSNHHFKSLGHSPDLIGLFFSIMDQFNDTATFVSDGQMISIDTSDKESPLKGETVWAKLFCGICNWLFHIMSDMAGSRMSRGEDGSGRGTGVAIPGMELFNLCDFGSFKDGKETRTLAESMVKVYKKGYDFRFGATMAIPVLIQDLMIRVMWLIRARYYKKRDWKECIPNARHGDLRVMLIVGDTTLCVIDGMDAAVRSGGNFVEFVLRLNLVAWVRLIKLVLKEVALRLGRDTDDMSEVLARINDDLKEYLYQLRQIDMDAFEDAVRELEAFELELEKASSEKEITDLLYREIEVQGVELPFKNHDEFNRFMLDDSKKLIL